MHEFVNWTDVSAIGRMLLIFVENDVKITAKYYFILLYSTDITWNYYEGCYSSNSLSWVQ